MSLKDDFLEALRSVKRDFFREHEYTDRDPATNPEQPRQAPPVQAQDSVPVETPTGTEPSVQAASTPPVEPQPQPPRTWQEPPVQQERAETPPPQPDEEVFEAYRQASALGDDADDVQDVLDDDGDPGETYRNFDPSMVPGTPEYYDVNRDNLPPRYSDFGDSGVYSDDKTIISKNTIIRGALQTEDSIRLLGQIMGDIECKSNIVVAGKVRGNTTAANAYIYDAQVDGDVRCDDAINVSDDAWVLGNIRAQQAEIEGKIKGNIEIRHSVSIGATSSILGDISTDELEIKRGAFINGQIMMYSPSRDVMDRFDSFDE